MNIKMSSQSSYLHIFVVILECGKRVHDNLCFVQLVKSSGFIGNGMAAFIRMFDAKSNRFILFDLCPQTNALYTAEELIIRFTHSPKSMKKRYRITNKKYAAAFWIYVVRGQVLG